MKISQTIFLSLIFLVLLGLGPVKAQFNVDANGNGGLPTPRYLTRLNVEAGGLDQQIAGRFYNDYTGPNTKIGISNWVTSTSNTIRYGISSRTEAPATSTSTAYGISNYTYNGKGPTSGIYNYTSQESGSSSFGQGIYNAFYTGNAGSAYGIYNHISSTGSGSKYSIYTHASNYGSGTTYALYASYYGTGTGSKYAGYFNGNVHVQGNLTWTSDARKKENIGDLQGALALIDAMQPKTYTFKEEKGQNLPQGKQFGFLAQDLQEVLPEAVQKLMVPASPVDPDSLAGDPGIRERTGENRAAMAEEESLGVNYITLIPILVQAVKEQQAEINALRKKLENK